MTPLLPLPPFGGGCGCIEYIELLLLLTKEEEEEDVEELEEDAPDIFREKKRGGKRRREKEEEEKFGLGVIFFFLWFARISLFLTFHEQRLLIRRNQY